MAVAASHSVSAMDVLAPPSRAPVGSPAAAAASARPYVLHRFNRGNIRRRGAGLRCRRRLLSARGERPAPDDDENGEEVAGFDAAVELFNGGEYHACHDVVEELWYSAEDPARTLLHGVLQCAVGFHHLFNQNHRGAMMELGEGLCKLRRLRLEDYDDQGPFSRFRDEVAAVLSFLYRTQKELAACNDELCLAMDGSATSYQLLGDFAAGQRLYRQGVDAEGVPSILFSGRASGDHLAPPCTAWQLDTWSLLAVAASRNEG
ncbi:uncharacterized protein LOC123448216 isoform X2 [Hordeum vulgare subsp. vulgare]|uniref:uncharacterized protein LOC123448216 isoform X2 n=1 Tax=Hordeum vulgare subsp. vulgare TaxID=112509 RepID=UPI001D1A4A3E|nr:uncharacterized protein LOC123448216 isoform X2 [Hordeum vulgare subsp. vulgare]XP_044980977.1 uncharacterized protein LOC123448216 isoform X2 [Hordeum vulgare subsp. vulgare]